MAANLALIIKAHDQASATLKGLEARTGSLGSKFAALGKVAAIGAGAGIVARRLSAVLWPELAKPSSPRTRAG